MLRLTTTLPPTAVFVLGFLLAVGCDLPQARSSTARDALAATVTETTPPSEVRRVWANASDYSSPSPDGRYVAFVDWSTGDVAMHDLRTGEDIRLTDKGSWTDNGSWAEEPLFSPDGRGVAYAYGNVQPPEGEWRYELRTVEVGDTAQRVLRAISPEDEGIAPLDWSETHGIAVEINRGDRTTELALVDPESGEISVLATYGPEDAHPHEAWFSPEEDLLAVRRGERAFLLGLEGRGREVGVELPIKRLLGWTPDGDGLLVHTSHLGETGIWALPVTDGAPSGDPKLVRASLPGVAPSGRAGDRYFYLVTVDAPKIYRATIEPGSGRVLAEPTPLTSALDGRASHPTWSPDGRNLAYTLEDPLESGLRFMVQAADGDAVREVARGDWRAGAIRNLRWTEGGEALVFLALTDGRAAALYRIDPESGAVTRLTDRGADGSFDVLPAEGSLLVLRRNATDGRNGELVAHEVRSGAERTVAALPETWEYGNVAVSPEGGRAALVYRDPETDVSTVALVELEDGRRRDLYAVEHPLHVEIRPGDLAWTPDGRHLLLMQGEWEREGSHEILSLPVEGGEPLSLMSGDDRRYLALHPDGRRLAFAGGDVRMELWVLDGVSEAVAAALAR